MFLQNVIFKRKLQKIIQFIDYYRINMIIYSSSHVTQKTLSLLKEYRSNIISSKGKNIQVSMLCFGVLFSDNQRKTLYPSKITNGIEWHLDISFPKLNISCHSATVLQISSQEKPFQLRRLVMPVYSFMKLIIGKGLIILFT